MKFVLFIVDCGYNAHKQCKDETAPNCQPTKQLVKRGEPEREKEREREREREGGREGEEVTVTINFARAYTISLLHVPILSAQVELQKTFTL